MKKVLNSIKNLFLRIFPFDTAENIVKSILKILVIAFFIYTICAFAYLCHAAANAITGDNTKFYNDVFRDFTQIAYYAVKRDAYAMEDGSSYSALFLLIMWPFAAIFKKDIDVLGVVPRFGDEQNLYILSSYRFWIALFLFYTICFVLMYIVMRAFLKKHGINVKGIFLVFILSGSTLFMVRRGNILMPSLILTLCFLCWYDSKNKVKAEFAILALAVAGVLKIYPLIFGVFLLKDKKWFASVRAVLYFALLYVLPLFCFNDGLKSYFGNLFTFAVADNRFASSGNISFASLVYKIIFLPFVALGVPQYAAFDWVCTGLSVLFLIFIVVAALYTRSYFKRCLLCVCAVILVPTVSYMYCVTFSFIAFAAYFKDFYSHGLKTNLCFLLICGFVYLIPIAFYCQVPVAPLFLTLTVIAGVTAFKEKKFEVYK